MYLCYNTYCKSLFLYSYYYIVLIAASCVCQLDSDPSQLAMIDYIIFQEIGIDIEYIDAQYLEWIDEAEWIGKLLG